MSGAFIEEIIRCDHPLFHRILQFNVRPALYLHPDRVSELLPMGLFTRLVGSKAGERVVSRKVIRHWSLDRDGFWGFKAPRVRIALLGHSVLERLILLIGATFHRDALAHAIGRTQIQHVKSSVGEEAYRFAVKRSPFLIRTLPDTGHQMLHESLSDSVRAVGLEGIRCCLADGTRALTDRFRLKLSPHFDGIGSLGFDASHRSADFVKMALRILRSEFSDEAKAIGI